MKTTLYKIEAEYLELINQVEELEGELTPELEQALAINESQKISKSIAYIELIGVKKSLIERIKAEKKRLDAMQKFNERIIDRLENSLSNAVDIFGDIELGMHIIKHRTSTQVNIENQDLIPDKYLTKKLTVTPDRMEIKKALQAGEDVAGANLITNKNLSIK